MKRNLTLAGALAALLAAGGIAIWQWPQPIEVVRPRKGPAVVAVYASGTVETTVMMPVAPRVGARLVSIDVDEGAIVSKGQVLGRLESADMRSNIAQLTAQQQFAQGDFDRNAALMAQGAVARQVFDRAQATLAAARAAVSQAMAQAGFMTLTSPGDCRVIQRDGEIGQFITANIPVFWIACNPLLRVAAQVDEEDVTLVRPGQKALIRADAFPGRIFEGHVSSVTPRGDPVGRSYRARIALPLGTPLQIGMTAEANIIVRETKAALLLPLTAIMGGHVWKIAGNRAVRAPVTVGVQDGDWAEIRSGVGAGDAIIRAGNAGLSQGQRVSIRLTPP